MRILIRATNWVGDAIMALPALRAIRKRFRVAHIAIVARPYVADLYRNQLICDHLYPYDPQGLTAGFYERENLARELHAQRFEVAMLLQNAFDAAWLAWRARIPERIGYSRDGRRLLLTKAVRVPKPGEIPAHEQFYYLELLRRAGWIDKLNGGESISLILPARAKDRAGDYMLAAGARPNALRIAIGAGASYGSAKCWAPERFAEVANRMIEEFDADVILFGTAGERAVADAISAAMRRPPIDLIGKTSMAELPGLLSECQLFLGNDSGAMHVAAAVGVPVVAIFGSTDPNGTAPVTPRCSIVQEKPYCNPCFLRRCPTDHRCMTRVLPPAVETAARSWLATMEVRPA